MLFRGDLAKLHPTSLLMFLTHLGKEGLLTVTNGKEVLSISLKGSTLVDAHSGRADEKLLQGLLLAGLIDGSQSRHINRVRKETGIPVRQVIEQLRLFPMSSIRELLENVIREVLFQLFLWETGQFHFVDVLVDRESQLPLLDSQSLTLEIVHRVDEWHDAVRAVTSLHKVPMATPASRSASDLSFPERVVLKLADGNRTLDSIITLAPFPSYQVIQCVSKALKRGWLAFRRADDAVRPDASSTTRPSHLFFDYRRSLRKIFVADTLEAKVSELINFCKDHFDQTLILTVKSETLARCVGFLKDSRGVLGRKDLRGLELSFENDPVFSHVIHSWHPYRGPIPSSGILGKITRVPALGECAVIPLKREGLSAMLLIVLLANPSLVSLEPNPLHYLELISWLVSPPEDDSSSDSLPGLPFLQALPDSAAPAAVAGYPSHGAFRSIRRYLKRIISAKEIEPKIAEMIAFCKDLFDQTLILTFQGDVLVRCVGFVREPSGRLQRRETRRIRRRIDDDPVFLWTRRSWLPFIGKVFASSILQDLADLPETGECAVIPLKREGTAALMIFASSTGDFSGLSPFHYLEIITWLVSPSGEEAPRADVSSPPAEQEEAKAERQQKPEMSAPVPSASPDGSTVSEHASRIVASIEELPPMPGVVTHVLQMLSDPECSMAELTRALSQDQSLVVRLIKVSNSALYGSSRKISTLSQAVTRMGTRIVRNLVLAAFTQSLFPVNRSSIGLWAQSLWQHSKECALASRRIAEAVHYHDPEEAFVGGLLHDIGKLVILLKMPDKYQSVRKIQASSRISTADAELRTLGCDHTLVGELLMQKWKMPANLQACVRYHHQPHVSREFGSLANIVACGDRMSHQWGLQTEEVTEGEVAEVETAMKSLLLSEAAMEELQKTVQSDFKLTGVLD